MAEPSALPADVLEALGHGNPIEAIKRLRAATGLGLKEAKDAVEAADVHPTAQTSGAPGEIPRSGNSGWWLLAIAVVVVMAYFVMGG